MKMRKRVDKDRERKKLYKSTKKAKRTISSFPASGLKTTWKMAQRNKGEQTISLPELRFKVTQSLLDKLGAMGTPFSLLLTIPARQEPVSVNGYHALEISYDQAKLQWKVDTFSATSNSSIESDSEGPMMNSDSDPILTQSVLSHII